MNDYKLIIYHTGYECQGVSTDFLLQTSHDIKLNIGNLNVWQI